MERVLQIPYISQVDGPGAGGFANDCGPASVAMLAWGKGHDPTVGEVYQATGVQKDQYISAGQLIKAAAKYGIPLKSMYFDMDKAKSFIDSGRPMIALVHYETFSKTGRTYSKFKGPHFLNLIGYKPDQIIVHDPLWKGSDGAYLAWSEHQFYQAWYDARLDGNSSFYGLLCDVRFGEVGAPIGSQPMPQPPKPDVWGTGIVTANALYLRHHPGGPIITALRGGTTVDVLEPKKDGWYHVRWEGVEGWCGGNSAYITVTQSPTAPPPLPRPDPQAVKFMDMPESERWQIVQDQLIAQGVLGKEGYLLDS